MPRLVKSAFRYPGSKEKIADKILKFFPDRVKFSRLLGTLSCYSEPFVGCGAMAVRVLPDLPSDAKVLLGDMDYGIVCLWRTVANDPAPLISKLLRFTPTVDEFYRLKELDGDMDGDPVELGFRKFVLHQMSFSGLGVKAGGPIGGMNQRSDYAVDCRFRPERHAKHLTAQYKMLRRFSRDIEVVHGDFEKTLSRTLDDGFSYLDPPYYLQGEALYRHNMSHEDHARLSRVLRLASYEWLLSYDDHNEVKSLYQDWANIDRFQMTATIDTKRGSGARRKNNELVITPIREATR